MLVLQRTGSQTQDTKSELRTALDAFRLSLTAEEKQQLETKSTVPTTEAALELTLEIDNINARRTIRRIGARLQPFLDRIQQFTTVVDSFVGFGPSIAPSIWGVVKITLLFAINATGYHEKLSGLLGSVASTCPRFNDYYGLFQCSDRVQDSLCRYFQQVVKLCHKVLIFSRIPSVLQVPRTAVRPFDSEFGKYSSGLEEAAQDVTDEIALASARLQVEESQLQKLDRREASGSRKLLASFSSTVAQDLAALECRWAQYEIRQKQLRRLSIRQSLSHIDHRMLWRQYQKQA